MESTTATKLVKVVLPAIALPVGLPRQRNHGRVLDGYLSYQRKNGTVIAEEKGEAERGRLKIPMTYT